MFPLMQIMFLVRIIMVFNRSIYKISHNFKPAPCLSHEKPVYNLADFKSLPLWLFAQEIRSDNRHIRI